MRILTIWFRKSNHGNLVALAWYAQDSGTLEEKEKRIMVFGHCSPPPLLYIAWSCCKRMVTKFVKNIVKDDLISVSIKSSF